MVETVGEDYWRQRDKYLKHPDGRAKGGEPCVVCGSPIPPNASWQSRDKHVCSTPCNMKLARRFLRDLRAGKITLSPTTDPYEDREPMVFLMDQTRPFPYEFLGHGPRIGDVVHRFGYTTVYLPFDVPKPQEEAIREAVERDEAALSARDRKSRPNDYVDPRIRLITNGVVCLNIETGASLVTFAADSGLLSPRLIWATLGPGGEHLPILQPFTVKGRSLTWTTERIRHWEDDREWTWEAPVCVPHPWPEGYNRSMQTPESLEHFATTKRISASTTRHARRVRMVGPDGTIERIDPLAIYERDGWVCGLCHEPIDRALKHPDMRSASLDHIIPLAANGTHTSGNVQAAHLICNIAKGARY